MNEHELTQAYIDVAVWAAWLICVVICFLKGKKYVAIASIAASIVDPIPIGGMYWHHIITQPLMWLPFIAAIRLGRPDSRWSNWFYRREKLKRSILKSNPLLREAAEQNDTGAQNNLGVSYRDGQGVAKDEVEAVKWFRKAAEQSLADAQYNLGIYYYYGVGVAKDYVEGYKWLLLAAAQGYGRAKEGMTLLENQITREQIAVAQKLTRNFKH
jgi:hypothetical protein